MLGRKKRALWLGLNLIMALMWVGGCRSSDEPDVNAAPPVNEVSPDPPSGTP